MSAGLGEQGFPASKTEIQMSFGVEEGVTLSRLLSFRLKL